MGDCILFSSTLNILNQNFRNCFPNGSQHNSLPGILLSIMLFVDFYKVLIPVLSIMFSISHLVFEMYAMKVCQHFYLKIRRMSTINMTAYEELILEDYYQSQI